MAEKYIGLMSGTSMDGVDAVLVEIDDNKTHIIDAISFPMGDNLKQALLDICLGQATNLQAIGELDHRLGHLFADAVDALLSKANVPAHQIKAIGSHGQTVFHAPEAHYPFTMQLGDANIISAKTGICTVADFRRKDMAFGGQGAPLVPAFHQQLFSDSNITRVILNIGGIANITLLKPDYKVIGYDTGPGNMLSDAWISRYLNSPYDKDAAWAQTGSVNKGLLEAMLSDSYFTQPAPKSTGRELFNLPWLDKHLESQPNIKPQDTQATLIELSAITIAAEVATFTSSTTNELLVCGGGVHNPLLMRRLAELLPEWQVMSTNERGIDSDNMEAMAFAWLAYRTLHHLPGNLPEVTGASHAIPLGAIYPA
ncbi:anhydro-N-acetylmuramic acid kinase [Photobacterium jeanii]|uniref:Anhydro-N-acetylmuramic acid kinase n=1 Tax=Photobacterium jeanii TaxID=858640 RepID=A0A178KKK3_9GAMM|nr:anhydro-N-acetylmuramic acid kinase [Photobacterium jeanii]OAN17750.1 anhydro-N-acetylmuramic acid kinase [Photobacterium jeanii]PST92587.1 anhydro-N-acetylmuramic acid kinase [Photobacterium jeanii]